MISCLSASQKLCDEKHIAQGQDRKQKMTLRAQGEFIYSALSGLEATHSSTDICLCSDFNAAATPWKQSWSKCLSKIGIIWQNQILSKTLAPIVYMFLSISLSSKKGRK